MTRALSTGQFLDFLGIRLDPAKAVGHEFIVNLVTPDTGETGDPGVLPELADLLVHLELGFEIPAGHGRAELTGPGQRNDADPGLP